MGRSVKSKYAVRMTVAGFGITPACWNSQQAGRPTAENLRRYVAAFEASTEPGGCNAHLGVTKVLEADIRENEFMGAVVARYSAAPVLSERQRRALALLSKRNLGATVTRFGWTWPDDVRRSEEHAAAVIEALEK